MRIITQLSLFDDTQNENLGDLERLQKVLASLPDAKLIEKLKDVFDGNIYYPADFGKSKNRIRNNIRISETHCLNMDN